MKAEKIIPVIGFAALGLLLAFVFSRVMEIRFSEGEIYPHYTTQRTDALGAQAIYDSFDRLDSFTVSRNYKPLTRIKTLDENTALFLLGLPRQSMNNIRAKDDSPVLTAIEKGARLIITVDPKVVDAAYTPTKTREEKDWFERRRELERKRQRAEKKKKEEETKVTPETAPDSKDKDKDEKKENKRDDVEKAMDKLLKNEEEMEKEADENFGVPIFRRWDINFAEKAAYKHSDEGWQPEAPADAAKTGSPTVFPVWHSPFRFEIGSSAKDVWKVIATLDNKPVVVERQFGKGTVVLTSDSFFASNESLHNGTSSDFLLWLVGDKRRLIFDETLHGSTVSVGAMTLIKKHRLHGLFIGLFVFVILWAWRSATSLAPGSETIDAGIIGEGGTVSGEESSSGMVRLLRRSILRKDVLARCAEIWKGSKNTALQPQQEAELSNILGQNRENPEELDSVSAYQRITDLLKKKV